MLSSEVPVYPDEEPSVNVLSSPLSVWAHLARSLPQAAVTHCSLPASINHEAVVLLSSWSLLVQTAVSSTSHTHTHRWSLSSSLFSLNTSPIKQIYCLSDYRNGLNAVLSNAFLGFGLKLTWHFLTVSLFFVLIDPRGLWLVRSVSVSAVRLEMHDILYSYRWLILGIL